ncbi:MAG: YdcF family protein [Chloroflexota bacterium]
MSLTLLILILVDLARRTWSFRSWVLLLAFLFLYVGGNFYFAHFISHSLESRHSPISENEQADAIVIIGGALHPNLPPRQSVEVGEAGDRIFHGANLYNNGYAPLVITSGGWVTLYWDPGEHRSEAAEMKDLLQQLGVPRDVILVEHKSQNTKENAAFTAALASNHNINKIILVTTARHMPRAAAAFENEGFEVIPAPTDYFVTGDPDITNGNLGKNLTVLNLVPQAKFVDVTTKSMKEYVGIVYYWMRDWI